MADGRGSDDAADGELAEGTRRVRADAQRNLIAVLQAAKEVFAFAGLEGRYALP